MACVNLSLAFYKSVKLLIHVWRFVEFSCTSLTNSFISENIINRSRGIWYLFAFEIPFINVEYNLSVTMASSILFQSHDFLIYDHKNSSQKSSTNQLKPIFLHIYFYFTPNTFMSGNPCILINLQAKKLRGWIFDSKLPLMFKLLMSHLF